MPRGPRARPPTAAPQVFTKDYFAFWVFIALIWAIVASFVIIALPIFESKDQILAVVDGIFGTKLAPEGALKTTSPEGIALTEK